MKKASEYDFPFGFEEGNRWFTTGGDFMFDRYTLSNGEGYQYVKLLYNEYVHLKGRFEQTEKQMERLHEIISNNVKNHESLTNKLKEEGYQQRRELQIKHDEEVAQLKLKKEMEPLPELDIVWVGYKWLEKLKYELQSCKDQISIMWGGIFFAFIAGVCLRGLF